MKKPINIAFEMLKLIPNGNGKGSEGWQPYIVFETLGYIIARTVMKYDP